MEVVGFAVLEVWERKVASLVADVAQTRRMSESARAAERVRLAVSAKVCVITRFRRWRTKWSARRSVDPRSRVRVCAGRQVDRGSSSRIATIRVVVRCRGNAIPPQGT